MGCWREGALGRRLRRRAGQLTHTDFGLVLLWPSPILAPSHNLLGLLPSNYVDALPDPSPPPHVLDSGAQYRTFAKDSFFSNPIAAMQLITRALFKQI
jgi:hypothetical protein